MLLRGCAARKAPGVAERVRAAIATTPFETTASPLRVTVSIGYSALPETPDDSPDLVLPDMLRNADAGLYAAKRARKNRVEADPADRRTARVVRPRTPTGTVAADDARAG